MKRTFFASAAAVTTLLFGIALPSANAQPAEFVVNSGITVLASTATSQSKKERREIRKAKRTADRNAQRNRQRHGDDRAASSSRGRSHSNDRASRGSRGNNRERGNVRSHRSDRDSQAHSRNNSRTHRDRAHSRSYDRSHNRERRHHDRRDRHNRHDVHFGVGFGGVHLDVHSDSHRRHARSHRRNSTHHYYRPRPHYRSYANYYPYTRPVIVEREVVVIEREPVYETRVIVERPRATRVPGYRAWDYLIHGESQRALTSFSKLAQADLDVGMHKLGFGFSALATGDLRNAAHGVRRAFEFEPARVSDGPGTDGFAKLVAELRAGVEHRIENDRSLTADHWFLSAAMAFYDRDYDNAKYAVTAARNLGDDSRGLHELEKMIEGKINYELQMQQNR